MITNQVINTLYKKYKKRPKSVDSLDFGLLFDKVAELHDVHVDMESGQLVIESVGEMSPFHEIPLSKIHAILPFDEWVAIVLHSSILFLNRKTSKISIHVKEPKMTLLDRLHMAFAKE